MSPFGRIFADDEELGKKDDDRKQRPTYLHLPAWSARKPAPWRRRRILYAFIACVVLYVFVKNIPVPDHPPVNLRPNYGTSPGHVPTQIFKPITETSAQKPPHPEKLSEAEKHYYDGPIRFYKLAASLYAISRLRGQLQLNKNVLFVASDLRSASELIPIACEMASWHRNDVHFAVMGRDNLELDEIQLVNGIDDDCKVNWHDARPDFSPWSSDFRMEVSVSAALGHIETFMHPQVVITDDQSREDAFFTRAIRAKASELGKSVIELPKDATEKMMWIARLDSGSLAAWQTTYVDILIHAPPRSSGSLLRLLRSIEAADYSGHRRPHLMIELPAGIDTPTKQYLEKLVWPPVDSSASSHTSQVTLRHRIPRRTSTVEEASIRFVESFYPARPANSHVLVLSPQVELSPVYYQFLMYHLLEYKYSSSAPQRTEVKNLMGLSLELPNMHLNESNMFYPPMIRSNSMSPEDSPKVPTPFLWQAPNSNAALYFGDKWVEFHSFLTSRVSLDPATIPAQPNLISKNYPSWLEYILELMRARGYTLLYPNFPSDRESVATVHYELFHPPEEFSKSNLKSESDTPVPPLDPEETFPTDLSSHRPKHPESTPLTTKLTSLLPNRGFVVPELSDLPLLSHQGNELSSNMLSATASSFSNDFRRQVGLCAASFKPKVEVMKADDLFCNDNPEARAGRSFADLDSDQPFAASKPPDYDKHTPVVKDDDAIRQREFEAHLSRQAGKKEDAPGEKEDAANKGGEAEKEERAMETKNTAEKSNEKNEKDTPQNGKAQFKKFLKEAEKEKGMKAKDAVLEAEEKRTGVAEDDRPEKKRGEDPGKKSSGRERGW
ncbi:MAG: hypothetical protein L6R42_003522 [Xanthoria sp. 1 TBL-2021]|nr:MAG: hypothetical protein L6R42_003522 [Xanthoria sp. 1 TBL-2021]